MNPIINWHGIDRVIITLNDASLTLTDNDAAEIGQQLANLFGLTADPNAHDPEDDA